MVTKKFVGAIMALLIGFCFVASAMGQTYLPLAKKGEIPNPSVLADRVEDSLVEDFSGNGMIVGANTTPNGFLKGIQAAGGTVDSVIDLPQYLRSLTGREMPPGELRLSRADQRGEVDVDVGTVRPAFVDEQGWFDANTGKFILAGECSNTHIPQHVITTTRGVQTRRQPFPVTQSCPLEVGSRYLRVAMYEPAAAEHECARATMLPRDAIVTTDESAEWLTPNRFSRECGQPMAESGFGFGKTEHNVEYAVVRGGEEAIFFRGTIAGDMVLTSSLGTELVTADNKLVKVPDEYQDGIPVVYFTDDVEGKLPNRRTPTKTGIGEKLSLFPVVGRVDGCPAMVYSGIDI